MSGTRLVAAGSLLLVCCCSCSQDPAIDRSEEPARARSYEEMIVGQWKLDDEATKVIVIFDSDGTWTADLRWKDEGVSRSTWDQVYGTWSLENDVLSFTYTEDTFPKDLSLVGDARSDRVLELNEETLRLEDGEGKTETYRRVR
ncbi:MAG TPA: lipocalin family protein [Thermoguttaceae bacterium]|nr:lipocalin family protein [Thermoguttaceae bacterium]